jgi:hypothetical protein
MLIAEICIVDTIEFWIVTSVYYLKPTMAFLYTKIDFNTGT